MRKIKRINQRVNTQHMIAAIDIGGEKNWVVFRSPQGQDCKTISFDQTREGYDYFYHKLLEYKANYRARSVVVGLESTGVYGEPIIHFLEKKNINQVLVNPVHSKRAKEFRDNSPQKTDKKDPRVIADLVQLNCVLSILIPKGDSADLRYLTQARERAISSKNIYLNQLQQLVWRVFPEFIRVVKHLDSKTALYLLKHCPRPEDIVEMGIANLFLTMRSISRGRYSIEKANQLFNYALHSIGLKEGVTSLLMEIRTLIENIEKQNHHIENYETEMDRILDKIKQSRYILSIKGIGRVITAGILGELANFETVYSAAEAEKLAGLNLYEISSGKHKGQKRISKRGRHLLRKLLYFAALNVIKHKGVFQDAYKNQLKRGKPKNKALIMIARKVLRVIFALIRDSKEYNMDYYQEPQLLRAA